MRPARAEALKRNTSAPYGALWLTRNLTNRNVMTPIKSDSRALLSHCALCAASLLFLSGCADNTATAPSDDSTTRVSLQLAVGNTAPRTVSSWADAQQVNDMRIYLFRRPQADGPDGDYTLYVSDDIAAEGKDYYAVTAFDNRTPYMSSEHGGKYEEHDFHFTPLLPIGYYYRLLAVGRDDKYSATAHSIAQPAFTADATTFAEASLSLADASLDAAKAGGTLQCSELFSGHLQTDDKDDGDYDALLVGDDSRQFSRTVTLRRAVAGLMLYVKNIPALVYDNTTATPISFTPTKLSLMATAAATGVRLASRTATDATALSDQTLATIDLSADNGWTVDADTHTFRRDADTDNGWPADSYMSTNYMMPTKESDMGLALDADSRNAGQKVTFCLHYTDGTHHRYDNIKIADADGGYRMVFPVEANHLYAIGQKSTNANEPYDLKKYYEPVMTDITIEIEPSFDNRHDFDVK